jgi:hypothetical protein
VNDIAGGVSFMTEEKTKRALRRMRRRTASHRRQRLADLRADERRRGSRTIPRSRARAMHHIDGMTRNRRERIPTRQELRIEAELQLAAQELGLP